MQFTVPVWHTLVGSHALPHETHAPMPSHVMLPLQPIVGPTPSSLSSAQTHCAPLRANTPVLHGVGFMLHAPPRSQRTHAPLAQKPPVHAVPSVASTSSAHVWAPVAHEMRPVLHGAPGLLPHIAPATHDTHWPIELHTWSVPQLFPGAALFMPSVHTGAPDVQTVRPSRHAVGFVLHVEPAAHATHWPVELQTRSVPHESPVLFGVPSTHAAPFVHCSLPFMHGFGFVEHAAPSVHVTHAPWPSQTWPLPHEAPAGLLSESAQTGAPVPHWVRPCLQAVGLPVHAEFCAHAMHWPAALQTLSTPHESPVARCIVPSVHVAPELLHVSTPTTQGFGFVPHAAFAMHATHAPAMHTFVPPQPRPSVAFSASMHVAAPVAHEVRPTLHAVGLPVHGSPAVHAVPPPEPPLPPRPPAPPVPPPALFPPPPPVPLPPPEPPVQSALQ